MKRRKSLNDVSCSIRLETALSHMPGTPHPPIGMDASPDVLGEIRAVPWLVLRNKITDRLVRGAVNPGTTAAITKIRAVALRDRQFCGRNPICT
jgi:hypothetical protein